MKNTVQYLMMLCTVVLTSCNLFIDEDLENQLIEYNGRGYDEVVTDSTEFYEVNYQFKKTTMELTATSPLLRYLVRVESNDVAGNHCLYFESGTPRELLPKPGMGLVSSYTTLFPYGLCDLVGQVEEEDGLIAVYTGHVDVQELFDDLSFSMDVPFGGYVEEYDVWDEEGNLVAHVNNRESSEAATRGDDLEATDDYLNIDIPFKLPDNVENNFLKLKGFGDHATMELTGGIKGKLYCHADFSLSDGLQFSLRLKDGKLDIGYKVTVSVGMSDPKKLLGSNDLLDGKVRIPVGPVVVVPVLGFSVNLQISGELSVELHYLKEFDMEVGFDGEDFYNNSTTKEGQFKVDFAANCSFQFPMIKISVGFGLYTSAISFRGEVYINLVTKAALVAGSLVDNGEVDIQTNPKITVDLKIGFAVAIVAKGAVITTILEKVKSYVRERAAALDAVKMLEGVPDYGDWIRYKAGRTLAPEKQKAIEEMMKGVPNNQRDQYIDVFAKNAWKNQVTPPTVPQDIDWKDNQGRDLDKDKEFALRLGPWYPEILTFPLMSKFLFPKMKEGSFRVGRNWDAKQEKLVFTAEFILDDPGLLSMARDYYPMFLIQLGSEDILLEMANEGEKLSWKTPQGKKFTAKFPGLAPDQTYTCRPGYAYSGKDRPSIWDKPITFSATTPSISIVDLKMTKNTREVMYDENIQPTGMIYSYSFDTYSEVKGSRNVSEWGIIDLNDQNAKTRVHTSKSSTLKSGQYIHHWSIKNTRLSKIKISLQPYVFAKDGNKSDWSEAKFFPVYHATIQDEFDFTDDSRLMRPVPADYGHQFEPAVLQLDSVTCDGMRVM